MSSVKTIYAGIRALGIAEEDDRRDLYERVTGKRWLHEMTPAQTDQVVDELRRLGFKPGFKGASKGHRAAAPRADLRFVHVLWAQLGKAGALKRPDRAGLNAFVRSRFEGKWQSVPIDIDALRDAGQINDVVRALKDMCKRAGVTLK